MTWSFPVLLSVMAGAALFCRFAGYIAMRWIPATPRIEAALRATPMAVMAGIAANAAAYGSWSDAAALGAAMALAFVTGNDVVAALVAVGLAALMRAAGF